MKTSQDIRRRQENAARQELRRLVSDRQTPSETDASTFGPWAEAITALRVRTLKKGPDACRALFLEKVREQPRLGVLLSTDPEPETRKTSWTWAELQRADFPDPVWVVPGIIPSGLVSIGGRPKIGKSWLALQIACAVGTGGRVFDRQVSKGKVLYLALEDSPRRLKLRAQKQLWPAEVDITFETDWPYLGQGGTLALRKRIEGCGYTLVIVDTLTRALGGADQMDLAETALTVGELQRLSQDLDVTVLLLDHHRKANGMSPDPVDDLFGSTGKAQPLDGVCGLYRTRGKKEAVLRVTGRDVEEMDLSLVFDGLTCTWMLAGEPGGVKKDSPQAAVLAAIGDITAAGDLAYASRVADRLDKDPSNTAKLVGELVRRGLVREGARQGQIIPLYLADGEQPADLLPQAPEPPDAPPGGTGGDGAPDLLPEAPEPSPGRPRSLVPVRVDPPNSQHSADESGTPAPGTAQPPESRTCPGRPTQESAQPGQVRDSSTRHCAAPGVPDSSGPAHQGERA